MDNVLQKLKQYIPTALFKSLQPTYHYALSLFGALWYWFPARSLKIVVVTGTKGKSSTTDIIASILEAAGHRVALANTIHFKIGEIEVPNTFKMTTPGRFFLQRFLREAVQKKCTWAVLEISSEAAVQYRHKFLHPDAFVFLNLSPEHIESHGGYAQYVQAKLSIGKELEISSKKETVMVINAEDAERIRFEKITSTQTAYFSLQDAEPWRTHEHGIIMTWKGEKISSALVGQFNIYNCIAAATCAHALGISPHIVKKGIEAVKRIKGRADRIDVGQPFDVVVDYAHTIDSLEKVYGAFSQSYIIGVLGNTGGGRDTWKRPGMAKIAETYCKHIFLTNEDPYDEDPMHIITDMRNAIPTAPVTIELDRRTALQKAFEMAYDISQKNDTRVSVLITGKGTDPYIMEAGGKKTPWSDEKVAIELLQSLIHARTS